MRCLLLKTFVLHLMLCTVTNSEFSGGWYSTWYWEQFEERPEGGQRLLSKEELLEKSPILEQINFSPLLAAGFTVMAVRHGSSPKFEMSEIVADLRRAVRFIRLNAHDYDVDSARIGVWGGSAGGHLSLLLGTTGDDGDPEAEEALRRVSNRVAAVVSYFPPTDLKRYFDHDLQRYLDYTKPEERKERPGYPALYLSPEEYKLYSPLFFASADDAPTLLIHGDQDDDVLILESTTMHEALTRSSVKSRLVTVVGANHGFYGEDADKALRETVDWFEKHLGVK